jgi:DeoR/GlpR family transcriptional regulator of sugar metabolism
VRVPRHLVEERRRRLARLLQQSRYLPVADLCRRLNISEATVRRDLSALEQENKIRRTRGGALGDHASRFPSFLERQQRQGEAKRLIAAAAVERIQPGMKIYLDVGTTVFSIAELIAERPATPLTIATSSLPVVEILSGLGGVSVHLIGGELLPRQSALLGSMARRMLLLWRFDLAFLSAEGMDSRGIFNTHGDIVLHQRVVLRRTRKTIFCIDASKLGRRAPEQLTGWDSGTRRELITDAPAASLRKAGVNGTEWRITTVNASATRKKMR